MFSKAEGIRSEALNPPRWRGVSLRRWGKCFLSFTFYIEKIPNIIQNIKDTWESKNPQEKEWNKRDEINAAANREKDHLILSQNFKI